jgi:hypothetical protein
LSSKDMQYDARDQPLRLEYITGLCDMYS